MTVPRPLRAGLRECASALRKEEPTEDELAAYAAELEASAMLAVCFQSLRNRRAVLLLKFAIPCSVST